MSEYQEAVDPRVVRTRRALQDALRSLIKTHAFGDLNVSHIVREADLSRPSFYAHFSSLDELLGSLMDDAFSEFYDSVTESELALERLSDSLVLKVVQTWQEHQDLIQAVIKAGPSSVIYQRFRDYAERIYLHSVELGLPKADERTTAYSIDFVASAALGFLYRWNARNFKDPAVEVANLFLCGVDSGLKELITKE